MDIYECMQLPQLPKSMSLVDQTLAMAHLHSRGNYICPWVDLRDNKDRTLHCVELEMAAYTHHVTLLIAVLPSIMLDALCCITRSSRSEFCTAFELYCTVVHAILCFGAKHGRLHHPRVQKRMATSQSGYPKAYDSRTSRRTFQMTHAIFGVKWYG